MIDAQKQLALQLLRQPNQRDNIRQAIKQITGKFYRLGPYRKPARQENKDDPLALLAKDAESEGITVVKK